jgi:hypothetical protein
MEQFNDWSVAKTETSYFNRRAMHESIRIRHFSLICLHAGMHNLKLINASFKLKGSVH